MNAETFLIRLQDAVDRALKTGDWSEWRAVLDTNLTYALKVSLTESQRLRLHELTHGFALTADPDGTWSDQLSDRLEREYRESLVRAG
jgi:hypothetical protein